MTNYIYTRTDGKSTMGSRKLHFKIWKLVKNTPVFICECTANSGSYKGDDSRVMNELASIGEIPKKYKWYYSDYANKKFKLINLYY